MPLLWSCLFVFVIDPQLALPGLRNGLHIRHSFGVEGVLQLSRMGRYRGSDIKLELLFRKEIILHLQVVCDALIQLYRQVVVVTVFWESK